MKRSAQKLKELVTIEVKKIEDAKKLKEQQEKEEKLKEGSQVALASKNVQARGMNKE